MTARPIPLAEAAKDSCILASVAVAVTLHRALARDGAPLSADAEAVDLPTDRGERRGADDIAPRVMVLGSARCSSVSRTRPTPECPGAGRTRGRADQRPIHPRRGARPGDPLGDRHQPHPAPARRACLTPRRADVGVQMCAAGLQPVPGGRGGDRYTDCQHPGPANAEHRAGGHPGRFLRLPATVGRKAGKCASEEVCTMVIRRLT